MPDRKARNATDAALRSSNYPAAFAGRVQGRAKRALGDLFGLDQFGVNLTEISPGAMSALRHWHSHEDEFVYVLDGELVLVTGAGEEVLRPGDCIGFKAGVPDGHHLVNRSRMPARVIEVGSRFMDRDQVSYPDDDLAVRPDSSGKRRFARKDGSPC